MRYLAEDHTGVIAWFEHRDHAESFVRMLHKKGEHDNLKVIDGTTGETLVDYTLKD